MGAAAVDHDGGGTGGKGGGEVVEDLGPSPGLLAGQGLPCRYGNRFTSHPSIMQMLAYPG
ncbi:hypothetical protein GCM10022225_76450 [Plantactinospora mayteni]|uniref:Uncharacterized protein n=1 Tax=Plantactinospora mayteni TaxID=566021 RepID=A0ABQ4F2D0_9ACTN|nr:hypothetical protein Pma05_75940 [Plantactinospora mayteni]